MSSTGSLSSVIFANTLSSSFVFAIVVYVTRRKRLGQADALRVEITLKRSQVELRRKPLERRSRPGRRHHVTQRQLQQSRRLKLEARRMFSFKQSQ